MPTDDEIAQAELDAAEEDAFSLRDSASSAAARNAYYKRSEEPDSWEMKGKIVRKDYVHLATRLIVFRCVCRIVPHVIRDKILQLKATVAKLGARAILWLTVKEAARDVAQWVLTVIQILITASAEADLEKTIRAECLVVQRQLYALAFKKHRKKGRRVVSTRHVK